MQIAYIKTKQSTARYKQWLHKKEASYLVKQAYIKTARTFAATNTENKIAQGHSNKKSIDICS